MKKQDNVISLENPSHSIKDTLTEIARIGAQRMLAVALEEEVANFLAEQEDKTTKSGHKRFVRNGYLPEREIQTGIGGLAVKQPRVRDRGDKTDDVQFHSGIIPPYLRRSKSIEELLPILYLRGISTGDFQSALPPPVR